jgi:hypothetical protein
VWYLTRQVGFNQGAYRYPDGSVVTFQLEQSSSKHVITVFWIVEYCWSAVLLSNIFQTFFQLCENWKGNVNIVWPVKSSAKRSPCPCVCVHGTGVCLHVCRLTYPICHMQASFCLCPLSLHHIFRHYLKKDDFRKKVTEHKMCVLVFSTTCIWNISHPKNKSARYWH